MKTTKSLFASIVMKQLRPLTTAAAALALTLMAGAANAVTISIAFQHANENLGAITTVAGPTVGQAFTTPPAPYGNFSVNSVSGTGSPPNVFGDLLTSTSLNVSSTTAGTITIYVT